MDVVFFFFFKYTVDVFLFLHGHCRSLCVLDGDGVGGSTVSSCCVGCAVELSLRVGWVLLYYTTV